MTIYGHGIQQRNMKSLIKKLLTYVLLLIVVHFSRSQAIGNSAYNVFGIGTLEQPGLVGFESMGHTGIGARPVDMVNIKNPAALNSMVGFTQAFDVGVSFSSLSQKSNGSSFTSSFGGLHDLNYWFRVNPKTALSLGVSKYSESSFDILDSQSGTSENGRSDSRHLGEGGSSQFYLAGGYQLLPKLNIGLQSHFLFGSLQKDEISSLSNLDTNLQIEGTKSFVKTLLKAGLQYDMLLGASSKLTLGSTFRTGGTTTMSEEEIIIGSSTTISSTDSLFNDDDSELYLPKQLGFGIGFQSKSWNLNLDYEFENWGANESQTNFQYQDRFIGSFGLQYIKNRFSENIVERLAFRLGGGLHSSYITVDDVDFLSQYYTVGVGIPINRGAAALSLSYQFYQTGTNALNLIQENTNTFSFSFSIRDIWFRKRVLN